MMKMQMRLDKSQVSDSVTPRYLTPGSYSFDRSLLSMAGYTKFDVMIVGASGGKCGTAWGNTSQTIDMKRCGGGGGGALRIQGNLVDLAAVTPIVVGAAGADAAADSTTRGKAPDGAPGGASTFGKYTASGGKGAVGGNWDRVLTAIFGGSEYHIYPGDILDSSGNIIGHKVSVGGAGGGNNQNLGSGGAGGQCSYMIANDSSNVTLDAGDGPVSAQNGHWVTGSPASDGTIVSGGFGGGGGPGDSDTYGTHFDQRPGGDGSLEGPSGPGGPGGSAVGGNGGGADIGDVTGVPGTYRGSGTGVGNGAVVFNIT